MKAYKAFRTNYLTCPKNIKCPLCQDKTMLSNTFEDHCKTIHGLDPLVLCVFCRNFRWPRDQKMQNGNHLKECHQRFKERYNASVAHLELATEPPITAPSDETICYCSSFQSDSLRRRTEHIPGWSERDISEGQVNLMYEPLSFTSYDDDWYALPEFGDLVPSARIGDETSMALLNTVKFHPSTGLDKAVEWIHRYLYHEKRFGWYHVCVRAGCIKSFVQLLQGLKIVELPYWCVCKGRGETGYLPENVATWKHHRHAILMVENKVKFKRCLERRVIYATGVVPENGKRLYCNEIKSVNHFISTIAYVSRSESKCNCDSMTSKNWYTKMLPSGQTVPRHSIEGSHYYIEKPVIPHAVIWMLLVVPGALERYCKFRVGTWSVMKLTSKVHRYDKWYISASKELGIRNCPVLFDPIDTRIGEIIPLDEVLPYATNPVSYERRFIYWFGGTVLKMMHFQTGFENIYDFQKYFFENKINTMFNFREDLFLLPAKGQRHANDIRLLENTMKTDHALQINRLELDKEKLNTDWQVKYNGLETTWQVKYNGLETKYNLLCEKYDKELEEMRKTIDELNNKLEKQTKERIKELKCCLEEERTNKRKHENELQTFKNKFEKCFSELEALKKSTNKKLKDSEAKFEAFRKEKYLPLQRDLHNALRREKRLRTKL